MKGFAFVVNATYALFLVTGCGTSHDQGFKQPLLITSAALPGGTVQSAYSGTGFTLTASGGTPPYAWSWSAAQGSSLPPGLALSNSVISGTPTTPGIFNVTVAVSDTSANHTSTNYNIDIQEPPAQFAFYASGQEADAQDGTIGGGPNYFCVAGSVTMDASGKVLGGVQDYNDGYGLTSPQPSGDRITSGQLNLDSTTGEGTLTLFTDNPRMGVNGRETLGFYRVNPKHALILNFDNTAASSGSMDLQTLPSTLSGRFAFALSGVNSTYSTTAWGGVFTVNGTNISSGTMDVNAGIPSKGAALTGSVTAADSAGRGALTFANSGLSINYYMVGSEAARIIVVNSKAAAVGSVFGQGGTTFGNNSLGASVFGLQSDSYQSPSVDQLYAGAGMFATTPSTGAFQGVGDLVEQGLTAHRATIAGTYNIRSDGYGSLTLNQKLLDMHTMGVYLTDPNVNLLDPNNTTSGNGGALLVELDFHLVGKGLLLNQTDASPASFAGTYAFGAQIFTPPNNNIGWEADLAGSGSVNLGVLNGAGRLNDPFYTLALGTYQNPALSFTGAFTPDALYPGRYTIPFTVGKNGGVLVQFDAVAYQANGEQFLWMDADNFALFSGSLQK